MSSATLTLKLGAISDVIRLRKQYGTLLLLAPTLWSLFIASGSTPELKHLVIFILGSFLMRSAGCVINDIADRDFDRHVDRTRTRPLADGRLSRGEAAVIFAVFSLLAFALVLNLNKLTILLSLVAIGLASLYPLIKRVSHLPQAFLGMAFGWGAVMAWSAVTGTVSVVALVIFVANIFWALSYDTIYALMDIEDDLKIGVKSTAILFGEHVYGAVTVFYAIMAVLLAIAGALSGLGAIYYLGVVLALVLFILILSSVRRNPTRAGALKGFVANSLVGLLVLAAIIIDLNL